MSWDIYVQELPVGIISVDEIPADFRPGTIGRRDDIVAGIMQVAPATDWSDPAYGRIRGPGFSINVSLGLDDPTTGFTFFVRGGDEAVHIIADILDVLGLTALDGGAPGALFSRDTATTSLASWRKYRDQVLGQG